MTKDNIIIWLPLKNPVMTQGFYENANNWYVEHGMMGHGAYDFVTYYNDNVLFAHDGYVYKIVNKDSEDLSKYRGVFQLVALEDDYVLEICYGHANKIYCSCGWVECGSLCISEGNTGSVWSGGKEVSVKERQKGSTAGTHLHIQGRLCRKVRSSIKPCLSSPDNEEVAYKDDDGFYYEIVDYYNGFNGCVPMKFSEYAGNASIYRAIIGTMAKVVKLLKDAVMRDYSD